MSLNITEKKAIVAEVSEIAKIANAVVATSYIGLDADQMTSLRAEARKQDVHIQIIKNTLAKKAFKDTNFAALDERLSGPLLLAFSQGEPSSSARVLKNFIKDNNLESDIVKFLWFDGNVLEGDNLNKIASLPTKDEAIAMLMSVIKAPVAKLARTIDAVKTQKEDAA